MKLSVKNCPIDEFSAMNITQKSVSISINMRAHEHRPCESDKKTGELKNYGATFNVSRKLYAWLRANVDIDECDVEPLNLPPPLPTDALITFPSFTHFHCFDKYSKSLQVNCMLERYKQLLVAYTIWRERKHRRHNNNYNKNSVYRFIIFCEMCVYMCFWLFFFLCSLFFSSDQL